MASIHSCSVSSTERKYAILYVFQDMIMGLVGWHAEIRGVTYSPYMKGWPIASLPEGTIGSVLVLVFDTVVIAVTVHHMLGTWRLQKGLKSLQKRSLTTLMLQQGELSLYIFQWIMTYQKGHIRPSALHVCTRCQSFKVFLVDQTKFRFALISGVLVLATDQARPCAILTLIPWPSSYRS